jgi:hypothetical protein
VVERAIQVFQEGTDGVQGGTAMMTTWSLVKAMLIKDLIDLSIVVCLIVVTFLGAWFVVLRDEREKRKRRTVLPHPHKFEANPLFPLVCLHCGREAYNTKYHEARTK